jgi:acyl-CoA dehydrogenase
VRRPDTPEEAGFRAEARAWLEANAKLCNGVDDWSRGSRDHGDEAERRFFERTREWQRTLADGGWAAITWAREHGGRGGTPAQALIFAQEASHFDVSNGFLNAAISLIGPTLIRFGSDAQRQRYLAPMLRGDEVWCQLFSEPEAGSDLAAVRTRAVLDGDEFVINGQKVWTTSAQYADFGFLLARTNPEVPKHEGISFLLVDLRQPGVEVRPLVTMVGDRHFNEVFFKDVRTPAHNVVNGVDKGWPVTTFVLAHEGASIGTIAVGNLATADIARAAQASGRFDDPLVRQRIGESLVEERVLDLLQARLRDAILDGRRPDVDGSVLKLLWSEGRHRKAETALWVQGADALLAGADAQGGGQWQTHWLSRSSGTVGGGTSEVHRNGLGERALGLPREPRIDRDQAFKDLKVSGD